MIQSKRVLRPQVINVFDNAVVQVKCVPGEDEINVAYLLGHALARFEFNIGMSFDLQFLSMDGKRLFAIRRYIVTEVTERIAINDVNHYQTLSKTVFDRKCAPIGDLIVFFEEGNQLDKSLVDGEPKSPVRKELDSSKLDNMSTADLQSVMKELRGEGFTVGTTKAKMMKSIRKHLSTADPRE